MITKLVDPAHEAAVAKVKTAFGNFCDAPTRRQFLYSGGGRNVFAGSGHEPDAVVYLYCTIPQPRRRTGRVSFSSSNTDIAGQPSCSALCASICPIHTRVRGARHEGVPPAASWGETGLCDPVHADGLLPLLPGVPAAMWVRRGCNIVHPAPGPFIVQYAVPPGRPICNIQERLFCHVPPGGGGGVVPAIMPAAAAVLAIDLGDVLAAFLSAGP